jgi:membrane fusion protein, multidrug efflux system
MIKRMLIMLLLVGVVLGGVFGFIRFKNQMIKKFITAGGVPVQTVSTTVATRSEWSEGLQAVGTVRAVQGIDVSAEVAGMVGRIYFHQGDTVKAGSLLVQLRDEEERSKLKALASAAEIARITYQRDEAQLRIQAVSKQVVDNDKANLEMALARLEEQKVLVAKKRIVAPFDGQLGLRNIDVGQHLNPGDAIVSLQDLHKVYVDFYLPQQALAKLRLNQPVTIKADVYPEQLFLGVVTVINPTVDEKTRNVKIRAILDNPDHKLLPGFYVTVVVDQGQSQDWVTLPRTAISFNPYGALVYKVEMKGKDDKGQPKWVAKQVFVSTGQTRGDQVAITEGVNEGDQVVTSGQLKLSNGMPVRVDNSVLPSNEVAPKPIDQ